MCSGVLTQWIQEIFNFNYIGFLHNPYRWHGNNNGLPPIDYEQRYFEKLSAV